MDQKLEKILNSVKLSPDDKYEFGKHFIDRIKKNTSLQNPDNNFHFLKQYLKDEIEFMESEISHVEKYSPAVYHANVALSRRYDIGTCKQLLDLL